MTWFRVGGAGIPASLKNAMNAVLNKKFGTSGQNYPPNGWPDDVNLLGPLPENMVSGAVASFADGADDVPIKSANFGIMASGGNGTPSTPVPIVGKNSVTVYHGKKNVFDITTYPITTGKAIRTSDGVFGNSSVTNRGATQGYIPCVSMRGKTWVINKPNQTGNSVGLAFYDENESFLSSVQTYPSGTNGVFTVPDNAYYFRFTADLDSADDTEVQIEAGTTATAFSPFYAPVSVTVSLGQTVYGGTLSEDGTLTVTHSFAIFDGSEDESWTLNKSGDIFRFRIILSDGSYPASGRKSVLCNIGSFSTGNAEYTIFISNFDNKAGLFYIPPQTVQTVEDFKTWLSSNNMQICYELATPIVITGLDEISLLTYLGYNNIWCDSGSSVITYRQDIALALAALQGSRGLMMSSLRSAEPMIGEESDPEEVNELEEPEITETEGENDAR